MTEKDVPKAISRIYGLGRNLCAKLPKSFHRKTALSPGQDLGAKLMLLLGLSLLLALILAPPELFGRGPTPDKGLIRNFSAAFPHAFGGFKSMPLR